MKATSTSFQKGNPGKPRGATNRATRGMQEILKAAAEGHADQANAALDALYGESPKDFLDAYLKLLRYFMPYAATNVNFTGNAVRFTFETGNPIPEGKVVTNGNDVAT